MGYHAELQALRELAHWLLPELKCCFCGQPILDIPDNTVTFGHRRHNAVKVLFTLHHNDEDRGNNFRRNLKICHKTCHRKHPHGVKPVLIQQIGKDVHQTKGISK